MAPALRVTPVTIALNFVSIYLIWGSTYLAIRFGVETMPPFLMAAVRFAIGGVAFYAWARLRGAEAPKRGHWGPMAIVGTLLLLGGNGLVTWGETLVPSGLTALLIAAVPMWIVAMDWLRPGGDRPRAWVIVGLVLGFLGVGALIDPTNVSGTEEVNFVGALVIVLATLLWALGSIYSRHAQQPESKTLAIDMQMLTGAAALLLFSVITGEAASFDPSVISAKSLWALAYLIVLGSIGFASYVWLLQHVNPAKVATYAYVNPVIALALGHVFADEPLSSWTLTCSAVIVLAVFMIITARARRLESPHVAPASSAIEVIDSAPVACEACEANEARPARPARPA